METMPNIILISDFGSINNGGTKVALSEAIAFASKGYHTVYFTGIGPIDSRLYQAGVKVVCLEQKQLKDHLGSIKDKLKGALQGVWNHRSKIALMNILKEYSPQNTIIHFHSWSHVLSPSLFAVTAKMNFKVVITCHDYEISCPTKMYFDCKTQAICERKARSFRCLCANCDKRDYAQKIYRFFRQSILLKLLKKNDVSLIYLSKFNEKIVNRSLKIKVTREYIVPNVVEIPTSQDIMPHKNKQYLFLGRISPEKGARLFCKAVTRANVEACVIGDGEELDELKKEYPHVHFFGWLTQDKMIPIMKKARCLIISSIWYENSPLVVSEVQCGYALPCIMPKECGIAEEALAMETALTFSNGNLKELLECIEQSKNDTLIKTMSDNCKNRINREWYSAEKHTERLENVYNHILGLK